MKKLSLLVVGSCVCWLSAFTQTNKWAVGVLGTYDRFSETVGQYGFGSLRDYKLHTAYSYGLQVQFNFNEKYYLKAGVLNAYKGYDVPEFNFIAIDGVVNDPSIPKSSIVMHNVLYLPVMYGGYYKRGEKLKLSASLGVVNEFLYQTKETSTFPDGSSNTTTFNTNGMSKYYFSGQLNTGAEYHFSEKLYLSVEPYVRYLFNEYGYGDGLMEFSNLSYGGILGLHFKFLSKSKEE